MMVCDGKTFCENLHKKLRSQDKRRQTMRKQELIFSFQFGVLVCFLLIRYGDQNVTHPILLFSKINPP